MLAFSCLSEPVENDLPPILDYYPSCSYQIIENAVESEVTNDRDSIDVVAKLLTMLKTKAKNAGADAVILTKKKIVDLSTSNPHSYKYQVSFSAELIKQCKVVKTKNVSNANVKERTIATYIHQERTIAAYNHLGIKAKGVLSFGGRSSSVNFSWSNTPNNIRPEMSNNEISLGNGVYGIQIGINYQQLIDALGEPNVKLAILKNELIIGYGRRHWFHFQEDKLVKIQNTLRFLSADTLNKIPLLDFFDQRVWKINKQVGWKTLLADVRHTLKIDTALNSKNQLVLSHLGNTLTLHFIYSKDHHTDEKTYTLDRFSLKKSDYEARSVLPFDKQITQNQAIEKAYLALQQNKEVNPKELETQLGDPVGQIILARGAALNIYNPHLLTRMKHSELVKIHLIEEVFMRNNTMKNVDKPWTLGKYKQGKSLEQLKVHFPEDTFVDDEEIEIELSNYTLLLFFGEENQQNSLYEAEITLY